ncbi:MAG: hypothetical protein GKR91_05970 [Pseudomonadales bacterium]|nr:hypothetical protein [Pseudomonadales bacterium]
MTTEIGKLAQAPPTFASSTLTPSAQFPTLPDGIVEDITKEAEFNASLSASEQLQNFTEFQYELVANQLTLLRNEGGEDSRIVFIQFPQWVYANTKKSKDYLALTKWSLVGYCSSSDLEQGMNLSGGSRSSDPEITSLVSDLVTDEFTQADLEATYSELIPRWSSRERIEYCNRAQSENQVSGFPDSSRVLDLIPRRSALNINDTYGEIRGLSLGLRFMQLIGIGGSFGYSRQEELYQNYVNQSVYASSFGKGNSEFGWIFGPRPGSDSIMPGPKTTNAILSVPYDAQVIVLKKEYCVFKKNDLLDENQRPIVDDITDYCDSPTDLEFIEIPNDRTNFWIYEMQYSSVEKGGRITVELTGERFSDQIQVMVNDTPLKNSSIDRNVPDNEQNRIGYFEVINSRKLILSFSAGSDFVGTPIFRIISPTRSIGLNYLPIRINSSTRRLDSMALYDPMFRDNLVLSSVESSGSDLVLRGAGFRQSGDNTKVFVNGKELTNTQFDVETSYAIRLDYLPASTLEIDVLVSSSSGYTKQSNSFANPNYPSISNHRILATIVTDEENNIRESIILLNTENFDTVSDWDFIHLEDPENEDSVEILESAKSRVVLRVNNVKERSNIMVLTNSDPDFSHLIQLEQLMEPSITSIVNSNGGANSGTTAGGELVTISGQNFEGVFRVTFGSKDAELLALSPTSLQIRTPAGENIVSVLLQKRNTPEGKIITNLATETSAQFTYLAPPS